MIHSVKMKKSLAQRHQDVRFPQTLDELVALLVTLIPFDDDLTIPRPTTVEVIEATLASHYNPSNEDPINMSTVLEIRNTPKGNPQIIQFYKIKTEKTRAYYCAIIGSKSDSRILKMTELPKEIYEEFTSRILGYKDNRVEIYATQAELDHATLTSAFFWKTWNEPGKVKQYLEAVEKTIALFRKTTHTSFIPVSTDLNNYPPSWEVRKRMVKIINIAKKLSIPKHHTLEGLQAMLRYAYQFIIDARKKYATQITPGLIKATLRLQQTGKRVGIIELGMGAGTVAKLLLEQSPNLQLYAGFDPEPRAMKLAREACKAHQEKTMLHEGYMHTFLAQLKHHITNLAREDALDHVIIIECGSPLHVRITEGEESRELHQQTLSLIRHLKTLSTSRISMVVTGLTHNAFPHKYWESELPTRLQTINYEHDQPCLTMCWQRPVTSPGLAAAP